MAWGDQRADGENMEDDEAEDELDENDYKAQKDAILFAIHVSKSMLEPPATGEDDKKADTDSAVAAALKSAYQIMQQRIIAQPKDKMGVLLFGTEASRFQDKQGGDWPHCYLLTDLDVPEARDVRALRDLVNGDEDASAILRPSREPVSMTNVFFCAARLFTTNAPNYGSRRLFIITDDDEPHAGDKAKKTTAATKAKDLYDLGVVIELFPITREGKEFDLTKFYDDIVYRDPTAEPDHFGQVQTCKSGDGLTLLGSLVSNINSKQTPKRALFSKVLFEIAPGLQISVKGYVPIHKQTQHKSCYIWTGGEEMQVAHGESVQLDGESKRTVEKVEFKKAFKFGVGGDHIYFSDEELKELKNFGPPVIRIIGFKPRSSLPPWASVKPPIFLFPSEEHFVGSTRVFSALWQKLIRDERIGIAWFIARSNASPVYAAVVPSLRPADEDNSTPFLPAGLWLCPLPFADDVRTVDLPKLAPAPEALIDPLREIMQNLQLPKAMYNPEKFPNPALQWHYRILQALALEDEPPEPEEAEDLTLPKYRQINKRVGGATAEWREELLRYARAQSSKRLAEGEDDTGPPAKRKKQAAAAATGGQAAGADISKLKVAELKQELAVRSLPTDGLKAALVARLAEAMGGD